MASGFSCSTEFGNAFAETSCRIRVPCGFRVLNAKATQLAWFLQRTWNIDSQ